MDPNTSLRREVGIKSNGLDDVLVLLTSSARAWREMGVKESRIDWWLGQTGGVEVEGVMAALTLATLFTKNKRKSLQSFTEKTGHCEVCGLTIRSMVSKIIWGLRLLVEMRLEK